MSGISAPDFRAHNIAIYEYSSAFTLGRASRLG